MTYKSVNAKYYLSYSNILAAVLEKLGISWSVPTMLISSYVSLYYSYLIALIRTGVLFSQTTQKEQLNDKRDGEGTQQSLISPSKGEVLCACAENSQL